MEEMKEKFAKELDVVRWSEIAREFAFKRLCVVEKELNIVEVATAMALDNGTKMRHWMDQNHFRMTTDEDAANFAENPDKTFQMLVVSPFVICQPV